MHKMYTDPRQDSYDPSHLQNGIVLSAYGGFYQVKSQEGLYICKIRGKMRLADHGVLAGDHVTFSDYGHLTIDNKDHIYFGLPQGMIKEILPRKNFLDRPKIANVDQALLVLALTQPSPDWNLLDRMLAVSLHKQITPVICINKWDLTEEDGELSEDIKETIDLLQIYRKAGFQVYCISARIKSGIDALESALKGKTTVVAGPSGVGKSSLLNAIRPELSLQTGDISNRLQRGKHTTRHVEMMLLPENTFVADTPGFSLLDLSESLQPQHLAKYYPEFEPYRNNCRFESCVHDKEPGCCVKEAVGEGSVNQLRYDSYLKLLHEIKEREVKY